MPLAMACAGGLGRFGEEKESGVAQRAAVASHEGAQEGVDAYFTPLLVTVLSA